VACIALLAALALPSFIKARQASISLKCISNQRVVFQAVQRYEADNNTTLSAIRGNGAAIRDTLLNAGYFLPIVYRAFFRAPTASAHDHVHGEAPLAMVIALSVTAAATVLLFFLPDVPMALARLTLER